MLTDPSSRYARDNLNGVLLGRRLDSPLLLTLTEEAARGTLVGTVPAGLAPQWSMISESWRGTGGLVNVPLSLPDGSLAVTPAQAVSAFFSSPIDALVIDRFLTMKDYWLMRSDL